MDIKFKKRKDEQEQVKIQEVLLEFHETFDETHKPIGKTFLRGGVVQAGAKPSEASTSGPSIYKPSPIAALTKRPSSLEAAKKKAEETARKIMEEAQKKKVPYNRPPKPGSTKTTQKTKMTNLEQFKEELKQLQEMRQERKGLRDQLKESGVSEEDLNKIAPSLDNPYADVNGEFNADANTTNLYVCNLPEDTRLDDLYETFGTFGPLASAKILYPRPEERIFKTLTGFVAYMSRIDAERALAAMNGDEIGGNQIKVNWAKPVIIPPAPFYIPPALQKLAMPDPPTGLPFNAKPRPDDLKKFLAKYKQLPPLHLPIDNPELKADLDEMISHAVVRVVIPTERPLLMLIHRTIEFVVRDGPTFEAMIMGRERANPLYRFLFDNHHPTNVYYRWKLYSILQGDDLDHWRLDRFKMFEPGPWWEPPPHSLFTNGMPSQLYNTAYVPRRRRMFEKDRKRQLALAATEPLAKKQIENQKPADNWQKVGAGIQQEKKKGQLSYKDRSDLEEILRNLEPEKQAIGDAMVWCLEHADCAKEIVQCLYESLTLDETQLHKKLARVYLISDILANCAVRVKDAFYFRQYFGEVLQNVFTELNRTYEKIDSRIKAEQFRQRVMLCFRMWEDNVIYPTETLINYQNIFLGLAKAKPIVDNPLAAAMEVDEDIDGAPLEEEDQLMEEDIDGAPLEEEDDEILEVKAVARTSRSISININKEPASMKFKEATFEEVDVTAEPKVSMSKWDELDEAEGASNAMDDEDIDGVPLEDEEIFNQHWKNSPHESLSDMKPSPNTETKENSPEKSAIDEEKRRQLLREIEMKVMAYQDELENDGSENVEDECQKYREKLMKDIEKSLEKSNSSQKSPKKEKKDKKHKKHKDKDKEKDRSDRSRNDERQESRDNHRDHEGSENGRDHRETRKLERDRRESDRDREKDRDRYRDDREERTDRHGRDRDREDKDKNGRELDCSRGRDYDTRRDDRRRDSDTYHRDDERSNRRDRSTERRRR